MDYVDRLKEEPRLVHIVPAEDLVGLIEAAEAATVQLDNAIASGLRDQIGEAKITLELALIPFRSGDI